MPKRAFFPTFVLLSMLTFSASAPAVFAAGIPVIDSAAIAQDAQNFAKQMVEMANQLQTLKSQLEQQLKQYEALTGDRGMGQLLDGQTRNYLPDDWQAVTKLLDSPSGYDSLSNSMQRYLNENKILSDSEAEKLEPNSKEILEKQRQLYALNRALSEQVYNEASERVALLQQLTDKIGSATDPKAILDLQARIQSEQTQLQNEAAKIQALSQQIVNMENGLKMQMREHIIKSGGDPKNVSNVFNDLKI